MDADNGFWRKARPFLLTAVLSGGAIVATAAPASAAAAATFSAGNLTVFGDNLDNSLVVSRDAAGTILVNRGAVAVVGGTPTVANTTLIQVFALGGNDTVTLQENNGALPRANLFGGAGQDVLTAGSGADQLFGQGENDTLLGKGGADLLFGGNGAEQFTTSANGTRVRFDRVNPAPFSINIGTSENLQLNAMAVTTLTAPPVIWRH